MVSAHPADSLSVRSPEGHPGWATAPAMASRYRATNTHDDSDNARAGADHNGDDDSKVGIP